jgi:phage terminase large subunit GpA-like protein
MAAATAGGVRPPERLTVAEAAERYRFVNNPGSFVGYWDNTFAPYLVEPMEALTSTDYTGMVFAGPARCGKSDMFFNWLCYTAICDPADMMAVHMTMSVARDWSQKDLRRAFRHSRALGKTVAPGRHNQSTHDIRFLSGMHLLVKWPTISELSGKTVPRNWIADYDRIRPSIDDEGSAFSLTSKRAETFRRYGMTVAESSPGFDIIDPKWSPRSKHEAPPVEGGVLSLFNQGDRRRWYWRCPHCADPFEPDFKLFNIPDSEDFVEAAEATVMGCPHCGGVIHHDGHNGTPGKHELNQTVEGNAKWLRDGQIWVPRSRDGQVAESMEGRGVRSDLATFWLKGPAANFADWRGIVLRYLQAMEVFERTGSQESLKTTINTDQGLPYLPKGSENGRMPDDIRAKAQDLGVKQVPAGVRFLVATIDVQKNRFEVQVHGFSEGGDICVIDRFAITKSNRVDEDGEREPLRPASYVEDWDTLIDSVLLRTYPLADDSGRKMKIRMVGCDSGGSASRKKNDSSTTKTAYNFWRRLKTATEADEIPPGLHHRFTLLKGASTSTAPRVKLSYPDSERKDRNAGARGDVPILLINTLALKDQLDVLLDRERAGGGRITFADWLPDTFWEEMVAEARGTNGWEKITARNEAWDLLVYAMAVSLFRPIKIEQMDWDNPPVWAQDWDDNSYVIEAEEKAEEPAKTPGKKSLADLAASLA